MQISKAAHAKTFDREGRSLTARAEPEQKRTSMTYNATRATRPEEMVHSPATMEFFWPRLSRHGRTAVGEADDRWTCDDRGPLGTGGGVEGDADDGQSAFRKTARRRATHRSHRERLESGNTVLTGTTGGRRGG